MATREIPPKEWIAFFDSFSRQHQGWLSTVEVFGGEIGAQVESRWVPLEGINADIKGPGEHSVLITVGDAGGGRVTHAIHSPRSVRLEQTPEGADEALEIESADGLKTLLLFRAAVLPELLDCVEAW